MFSVSVSILTALLLSIFNGYSIQFSIFRIIHISFNIGVAAIIIVSYFFDFHQDIVQWLVSIFLVLSFGLDVVFIGEYYIPFKPDSNNISVDTSVSNMKNSDNKNWAVSFLTRMESEIDRLENRTWTIEMSKSRELYYVARESEEEFNKWQSTWRADWNKKIPFLSRYVALLTKSELDASTNAFNNIISRRLTDKELININVKTPQNLIGSTALESPQVWLDTHAVDCYKRKQAWSNFFTDTQAKLDKNPNIDPKLKIEYKALTKTLLHDITLKMDTKLSFAKDLSDKWKDWEDFSSKKPKL